MKEESWLMVLQMFKNSCFSIVAAWRKGMVNAALDWRGEGGIRREDEGAGGWRRSGTQKFVYQKEPKSMFPSLHLIFARYKIWVQRGGGTPGGLLRDTELTCKDKNAMGLLICCSTNTNQPTTHV